MDNRDQHPQVNTDTGGWQDCKIIIEAINTWREVDGFNIPPGWVQVQIQGKNGKVKTKWLSGSDMVWRYKMTSGDLEYRKKAAKTETAWHGCGTEPGTWVWRIEQFKVVAWPKEMYGKFHTGDSYIVLHTEKEREDCERLTYRIHFWIGRESTIDEQGTAAIKTVELDSYFDERPSQYREVQDGESDEFRCYFKDKLEYLEGGTPPGWNVKVSDIREDHMIQVWKDKRVMRHTEVPVTRQSLNHRDSFLLGTGNVIYVWHGDDSNIRFEARSFANKMKAIWRKTEVKESDDEKFWDQLGGKGPVTPASEVGDKQVEFGEGALYEIQIEDGTHKVDWKRVKAYGDLERKDLNPTGVMLVDTRTEIYVWIGKEASTAERNNAWFIVHSYLRQNGKGALTANVKVLKQGSHDDLTLPKWIEMFPVDE